MKYPHLSSLIFNQPLLCTQDYAETILAVLGDRLEINVEGLEVKGEEKEDRPVSFKQGTMVIPVLGSMSHRATGIEAMSGMTSYSAIQHYVEEGMSNPEVANILFDYDSPGGSVAGAFDLRDYLMSYRGKKPMYALARDSMCSAAYLLGSTADKVFTTQTGQVGSIGVVAMLMDRTKKNEMEGVKPVFIHSGKYKLAGNPNVEMNKDTLEYLQESVENSYDMFVKAVSGSRGISEKSVRETEARVYKAKDAMKLGLVDGVTNFESAIMELSQSIPRVYESVSIKGNNMDKEEFDKLSASVEKLKTDNEKLRGYIIKEGYAITSEGIEKTKEPEMIEVDGEKLDKASIPPVILKALEKAATEKLETDLKEKASQTFPHFDLDVSKSLYVAFKDNDKVMSALKAADTMLAGKMEEVGETAPQEFKTAQEKLDAKLKEIMNTENVNTAKAYQKLANTADGSKLIQDAYNEKDTK